MGRFLQEKKQILTIAFIAVFAACLPLFTVNCIQGHDIEYHLLRIEALKAGIQQGLPFLRVNVLYFGGEGYASSLFYPDFLLYLPAVLRACHVGINASFHIFVFFCIAAGFAAAWYCVREITGDSLTAVLSAVIFTLCQYHIDDIYTRSAVGEYTAFIFLPFVIAGLYDLMFRDLKKPWLLAAGMTGVLLCHTLTTLFCVGLCFLSAVFSLPGIRKNPRILLRLLLAALAVLCITAFYWLPMLEQMRSAAFHYSEAKFDLNYEKMLLKDVFRNQVPGMGAALFLLLLPRLFISPEKAPAEKGISGGTDVLSVPGSILKFADLCLVFGILFTLGSTGLLPWKRLSPWLDFVQFPWRLFIMASALLSVAAGIYVREWLREKPDTAVYLVLAVMLVSAVMNFSRTEEGYYSYSDDYYDYEPFTETVIGGEWLPGTVTDRGRLGNHAGEAFAGEETYPVERQGNALSVTGLSGTEDYVDVPFIYYKGYGAFDLSDGHVLETDGSGENGRVRVKPGGSGGFTVRYIGTPVQHAADWLSLLTALALAGYLLYSRRRRAKKSRS